MERGLVMLLHSVIIGILLYAIMVFLLGAVLFTIYTFIHSPLHMI